MKVLTVSSPHSASTRDVWRKLNLGLEANGVTVRPFDLMTRANLFDRMNVLFEKAKIPLPDGWEAMTLAYEPILGAAIHHDCDAVIVVSPQYFPAGITDLLKKVGIKTYAYFTECPYEDEIHMPLVAATFDGALLSDLNSVGLYQSFVPNGNVMYVPHCYDPNVHYPPENDDAREEKTVFIGTGYDSRESFFAKVDWPKPLFIYGGWWKFPKNSNKNIFASRSRGKNTVWTDPKTGMSYIAPPGYSVVPAEDVADFYRTFATSFSAHRTQKYWGSVDDIIEGEAYSLGPRNWELAACRIFQVSDFRQELADVFGDSVPLYETPRELGDLLKRAFDDPAWRKDLAFEQWERAQPYSLQNVMRPVAQFIAA